jgi:histidinol-phosphatase (PHP family)
VGHFDLITKHMEKREFFNVESKEYRCAMIEAAEALAGKIPYFEVNTGAIARGFRTTPYPDRNLLYVLKKLDAKLILSSDSHAAETLDYGFDEAKAYLRDIGFRQLYTLYDNAFVKYDI